MKNHKQYLIVGSFVLFGIASIIAIILWFGAANRKSYDTYRIVFHEPVDGISTSSMVKYNGVDVGRVKQIQLDTHNPSNIYVDININRGLNITVSTYATLKPQGVTGMSYVALNLASDASNFTPLQARNLPPYVQIPAKPSFLYHLTEQAQSVANNMQDISVQVKALLTATNLTHIANILNGLDKVTTAVATQSDSIANSFALVGQVLTHVNENTQHLNDAIVQLASLSKSLQQNSVSLDQVLSTIQNNTLRNINTVFLPNLNQTVSNMNGATAQFNELITVINRDPSVLIRGKATPLAGPGE